MKRLFVVFLMVLTLPVLASMVGSRHQAQAFNSVAVAGHSQAGGGWCQCGCDLCICEPGEVPMACGGNRAAQPPDTGAGWMLALFALGLAARFLLK